MKLTIVINGRGGVGKDTLCSIVAEKYSTINVSSIEPIKGVAKLLGWNGEKDDQSRKYLSDLKKWSVEYNDWPTKYLVNKYHEFEKSSAQILFVHIREGNEIDHFKQMIGDHVITLLIRRNEAKKTFGNKSDDDVENYEYDYIYDNDLSLDDTKEAFLSFIKRIIDREWR